MYSSRTKKTSRLLVAPLFFLFIFLSITGCTTPSSQPHAIIDWVDLIKFKGISYIHISPSSYTIKAADLGPVYDTVKFHIADNVTDPNYQTKDGDATFLPVGTNVYTLKNYKSSFRLVAQTSNGLALYQVVGNEKATKGSERLDIAGKVTEISLLSPKDDKTELARITARDQVENLVSMLLNAPTATSSDDSEITCFLVLHLKDGSTVDHPYHKDINTYDDLQLPATFQSIIEQALTQKT